MRLPFLTLIIVLSFIAGCQKMDSVSNHEFHAAPDRWKEPRTFQTPVEGFLEDRITVEKRDNVIGDDLNEIYSPNRAYWYSTQFSSTGTFQVIIFNEKRFIVIDTSGDDHYGKEVKWVNEKVLYIRDWIGKVAGIDLIYDVEKEEILYLEQINDGAIPFVQWQQNKHQRQK